MTGLNSETKKEDLIKSETLPLALGAAAYLVGRSLPIVSKELSIFKKIDNSYVGGVVDGLGNVRNLSAILMGGTTIALSHILLNKQCSTGHVDSLQDSRIAQSNFATKR